jgi:hypothetical protein
MLPAVHNEAADFHDTTRRLPKRGGPNLGRWRKRAPERQKRKRQRQKPEERVAPPTRAQAAPPAQDFFTFFLYI